MELYPAGIQSGYASSALEPVQPGMAARTPPSKSAETATDVFGPTKEANSTYGRDGKIRKSLTTDGSQESEQSTATKGKHGQPLSHEETAEIKELKQADQQVRAHEMAHLAAGAGLVKGGASYSYKQGPDGKLYAVAGEVSIDTSEGNTPQETITRMQRVKAAALAPADPSPQDRAVAAAASAKAAQAAGELAREKMQMANETGSKGTEGQDASEKPGLMAYQKTLSPEKARGQSINTIL